MERKKIVITGMGAVTPIGVGVERYWDSLVQGVSGIDTIQKLDVEALPIKVAGEVKDFRAKDYMSPKLANGMEDFMQYAYVSAEEALAACDLLLQRGVRADCCKLVRIVPLPEGICEALAGYKTILFAEECVRDGGIGQQLCFALQQSGWRGTFLLHAVDNRHLLHANVPQLRKDQALDAAALADSVLNILTSRSME